MRQGQKFERPKNRPFLIETFVRILSVLKTGLGLAFGPGPVLPHSVWV